MRKLWLVDDDGGRLAALAAGMALLEGAPGFDEVIACAPAQPASDPLIAQILDEVGLRIPPVIQPFASASPGPGDVVISLGQQPRPGASAHWPARLPPTDAHPLVQRSAARTTRDALARRLAAL